MRQTGAQHCVGAMGERVARQAVLRRRHAGLGAVQKCEMAPDPVFLRGTGAMEFEIFGHDRLITNFWAEEWFGHRATVRRGSGPGSIGQ